MFEPSQNEYAYICKIIEIEKVSIKMCEAFQLLFNMKRLDFIKMVSAVRRKEPQTLKIILDVNQTVKELKKFKGLKFEVPNEPIKETPPDEVSWDIARARLKALPELEAFLKRKGKIIAFCTQATKSKFTDIFDAFNWSLSKEKENFWKSMQMEFNASKIEKYAQVYGGQILKRNSNIRYQNGEKINSKKIHQLWN